MRAIITIALKDLRLLTRDRFGMFWVLLFPLLMALFFGAMFSGEDTGARKMSIAAVGDRSAPTQAFFSELAKSGVLNIRRLPLDSARDLVAHGKLTAFVRYVPAPGEATGFAAMGRDSVEVGIDPARRAEAGYLQGLISQAYFAQLQSVFTDRNAWHSQIQQGLSHVDSMPWMSGEQRRLLRTAFSSFDTLAQSTDSTTADTSQLMESFGNINLKFSEITNAANLPRTGWEITFPQSILWALIGCAATFALSIVTERRIGTYLRLRLAPLTRIQILLGKGLACFVACAIVSAALMTLGITVFKVRVGSPGLLALAILASAFCFVGIMMLISVLGKSERSVAGSSWAILLVMSMIGGGMIPLMFMPSWVAAASNFSSMKWCALATEGAIWRGFTLGDMLFPVGIQLAIGIVGFAIGTVVMSRTER